jgi:MFS family permease
MDSFGVGFHVALLTIGGVIVGPMFGHYSDKIGRRVPMVAALVAVATGMLIIGIVGEGIIMVIALGIMGIFLWSVQDVTNAAALDAAPRGQEGSVVGMMFSSSLMAGIIAPSIMLAAILIADTHRVIFFVAAAVVLPAILVMATAPLARKSED